MTNRFFPEKQINNARVARPVSGRVFVWLALIAVAGTLLSSGFVISARQHFEAVSLGYKSEELRREASQLSERLKQLELEHARATSPVEIERRAQKIGLKRFVPESRSDSQPNGIRRPALTSGGRKARK